VKPILQTVGCITALCALVALLSCDDRSSSVIYLKPRIEACLDVNGDESVQYHGWPLEEQFSISVIGGFDVDGEEHSGLLNIEIPSREKVLSSGAPLPVCGRKKDTACKDREDDYVIASYREFDVSQGGDPVLVFDSTAQEESVSGNLQITETAEEFNFTRLRASFEMTFTFQGRYRRMQNGGIGIFTTPPPDTGDCPED